MSFEDALRNHYKNKRSCYDCSYYELDVISIFPYEYCYKHNKGNVEPCDFKRCEFYTESKKVRVMTFFKSIIHSIKRGGMKG